MWPPASNHQGSQGSEWPTCLSRWYSMSLYHLLLPSAVVTALLRESQGPLDNEFDFRNLGTSVAAYTVHVGVPCSAELGWPPVLRRHGAEPGTAGGGVWVFCSKGSCSFLGFSLIECQEKTNQPLVIGHHLSNGGESGAGQISLGPGGRRILWWQS